jgi:glutamyl-Q tRNA(Asp) synthetase
MTLPYVGRYAPSPTGPLHFGSLVAALASWLDCRHAGGQWRLRMDDLDPPRVMPGAADVIQRQLESFGLTWDGEVLWQSRRTERYLAALDQLRSHLYPCTCTRRELEDSAMAIDGARVYPGTCRDGASGTRAPATRVRTTAQRIEFEDRLQGPQSQSLARDIGDFVLRRADGLFSYQLAIVVDDAEQGVTDVVRGADLLQSTARQIWLQRLLALPTPRYLHVPVVVNAQGEKLSKQTHAADATRADIPAALRFLGLPPPVDLDPAPAALLAWALAAWSVERLPRLACAAA